MENRFDGGGAAVAIGLSLLAILLLLAGGMGIYFFVERQQRSLTMQVERAHLAEVQAKTEAGHARDVADAAVATLRMTSNDSESATVQGDSIRAAVESILRAQGDAWNRSDLDAFMEHYWKSDLLTFSSGGKTTRGWADTLKGYRERYPNPEKMGRLKLRGLEITPLGDSAALVLGIWNLERENDPVSGSFTLVVRKFDDHWLIVHDHTSRQTD